MFVLVAFYAKIFQQNTESWRSWLSITNREAIIAFLFSIVGAIVAGLVIVAFEQLLAARKERRKQLASNVVRDPNADKVISDGIYYDLAPGKTVELMRQMLGVPTKYSRLDFPVFSEDEVKTHSYLYIFKNAYVKVSSKDNETIDTLTVLPWEDSFPIASLLLPEDVEATTFRNFKVTPGLVQFEWNHTYISTIRDSAFAFEFRTGPPTHLHYVFFGYGGTREKYEKTKTPKAFIGEEINGLCISSTDECYYIFDSELR